MTTLGPRVVATSKHLFVPLAATTVFALFNHEEPLNVETQHSFELVGSSRRRPREMWSSIDGEVQEVGKGGGGENMPFRP